RILGRAAAQGKAPPADPGAHRRRDEAVGQPGPGTRGRPGDAGEMAQGTAREDARVFRRKPGGWARAPDVDAGRDSPGRVAGPPSARPAGRTGRFSPLPRRAFVTR